MRPTVCNETYCQLQLRNSIIYLAICMLLLSSPAQATINSFYRDHFIFRSSKFTKYTAIPLWVYIECSVCANMPAHMHICMYVQLKTAVLAGIYACGWYICMWSAQAAAFRQAGTACCQLERPESTSFQAAIIIAVLLAWQVVRMWRTVTNITFDQAKAVTSMT